MAKSVLLVDDDVMLRTCLQDLLSDHGGFTVRIAADGAEALRAVEEGFAFDVLLTDKDMPVMRGDDLITELRRRGYRQYMILMTGDVRFTAAFPAADLVVAKPFSIFNLFEVIRDAPSPVAKAV